MQIVGRTWLNHVTWTCGSWSEGQHDLYFTVQWFCLISWRPFDVCTSYFGSMNQYDPTFDLKINVGQCDLYSMVQWFCLISWRLFDVCTLLFGIMSQYDPKFDLKVWPQNKHRSLWPIFYGPVILPYILKTVWCIYIILWKYESVRPDLKINVGHCDLYSLVQWFCLISWRLFDVRTFLFGIMSQYDPKFNLKINIGHCDLYFMAQWFCVTSWRLFDVWTSYFEIKGQYDLTLISK